MSYLKKSETYDMPFDLIHDLYQGDVDAIIIGDNYTTIFPIN